MKTHWRLSHVHWIVLCCCFSSYLLVKSQTVNSDRCINRCNEEQGRCELGLTNLCSCFWPFNGNAPDCSESTLFFLTPFWQRTIASIVCFLQESVQLAMRGLMVLRKIRSHTSLLSVLTGYVIHKKVIIRIRDYLPIVNVPWDRENATFHRGGANVIPNSKVMRVNEVRQ